MLLDQALADFAADDVSGDDDSLVAPMRNDDEDGTSDLALAVVLEDDANWWSL